MRIKVKIVLLFAALTALLVCGAAAAQGVTVEPQDSYSCDYGVDIPFTRSGRTKNYTFSLFAGDVAAGALEMSAKVTIVPPGAVTVHLPLRYPADGPSSWTLRVTAHVEKGREGLDREAAMTKAFTISKTSCGCASGTKGAFYAGDGSEESPFRVATPDQLDHVRVHNERCYRQIADLDFAGWGDFRPIWPNASSGIMTERGGFVGTYDGGGHVLSNLHIVSAANWVSYSLSDTKYIGYPTSLFYAKNLKLYNLGMDESCSAASIRGNVASFACGPGTGTRAQIVCCYSAAALSVPSDGGLNYAGGLLGLESYASVKDCYFAGSLSAPIRCTGLVNQAETGADITNSYNLGAISGSTAEKEGIFSFSYTAPTFLSCFSISSWPTVHGANLALGDFQSQNVFADWDFDTVWRMGQVVRKNGSGGSETVEAPVLRVFDNPLTW